MRSGLMSTNVLRLVAWFGAAAATGFDQQPLTTVEEQASGARNPFTDEFAQIAEQGLQDWHVAGFAISVVDGNDTFATGFGFATLPDVPATAETLWYVGSTTKAFTTASLATLIDSNNHSELSLGWKTQISAVIRDDFVLQDEWATAHLTLEDAASHRTGMTRHDQTIIWEPESPRGIVKHTVRNLRNLPIHIEPRTEFHYCNLFYTVLTHVIETLTGKRLGDVMKELIWEPLGMNSTYYDLDEARAAPEHLSQGYAWHEDIQQLKPLAHIQTAALNGAGAMISNVIDYTKWLKCLINKTQPFSQAVHNEIRTPRIMGSFETLSSDMTSYSLSWVRSTIHGRTVYLHSGSTLTHGALVYWFPDDNYGVTIFANSVTPLRQILMYKLLEEKFNVPKDERVDVEAREKRNDKEMKRFIANATNIAYPNRPSTPLPPSLNLSEHAGTYEDAGYGAVRFYVGSHPSRPKETTLIAERTDRGWNETVRMEHVTGDWWLWCGYIKDGPSEMDYFSKAEFRTGPDGKVSSLEVEIYDYIEDLREGIISYKKVG
ncbi:hypothetical protein NLU13_1173 [Sarocladium strictum]|uniref:Beta-lactamase-related domain-containing protein n=1 Tax=Sarocladium strictum TaxID=5046 RepID=A0AA39GSE6_SARSR|nr:hypothetical protein NLU13_1173 [Sarocladium strictum]